jgi:hypothetical protein
VFFPVSLNRLIEKGGKFIEGAALKRFLLDLVLSAHPNQAGKVSIFNLLQSTVEHGKAH